MKKLALLLMTILFSFSLTACDPHFGYLDETGVGTTEISSVQLIKYDISDVKEYKSWMPYGLRRSSNFKNDKYTVIETLSQDKNKEFVGHLKAARLVYYLIYDSPKGICLKITYSNGNFLIVSFDNGYICEYSADGSVHKYYGTTTGMDSAVLANEYFEYQIPVTDKDIEVYEENQRWYEQVRD